MDDAMAAVERGTPALKGVLLKDYARSTLDKEWISQIAHGDTLQNDCHKRSCTSKADFIVANPPFNISSWGITGAASSGGQE